METSQIPKSVDTVTIHPSVRYLKYQAFEACMNLKNVDIPSSVMYIGDDAFFRCTNLRNIHIPNTMRSIGFRAFTACTNLTSITLPPTCKRIGPNAFDSCRSLKTIVIPPSITKIESFTFYFCTKLTSVFLPKTLRHISTQAFSNCHALSVIELPESVSITSTTITNVTIEANAFRKCHILKEQYKYQDMFPDKVEQKRVKTSMQTRFSNLPLHQVCYNIAFYKSSTEAYEEMEKLVQMSLRSSSVSSSVAGIAETRTNHLTSKDEFGMTALHILCSHPSATPNMIKLLTAHTTTNTATHNTDPIANQQQKKFLITPLAMFMECRGLKYKCQKCIDHHNERWKKTNINQHQNQYYHHYKRRTAYYADQSQNQLPVYCSDCRLPLDQALKQGIRVVDLECLFLLDVKLRLEQRRIDAKTGFYPFVEAAMNDECGLDMVYSLLRNNVDLIM